VGTPWILAVDLGTGGPKVGVVGLDGTLLARAHTEVPILDTADGGREQDVEAWWDGIRAGVRSFLDGGAVRGEDLHAVGLTAQYSSTVPVGPDGTALGNCLMWSDQRGGRYARDQVGGPVAGLDPRVLVPAIRVSGMVPLTTGEDPLGHELFLRHGRPDLFARAASLLEPVDYLGLRMTGVVAATPASMFLSSVVDNRPGRRAAYVPSLVARLGRDPRLLPPLRPTGSVLGAMLPAVAADLGVRAGAPVVCGVPDFVAAYLGSGAAGEYEAHVAISTTSWLTCRVPFKKVDPVRMVASVPGVAPGSYLIINDQASAGHSLGWWLERTGQSYPDALAAAARTPAGACGTMFLPWLRGEHTPVYHRHSRAGFVNLSVDTDLGAMNRAVLEGVAYNSRWLLAAVERFIRRPVPSLRLLGGGAQSELWCQVYADVLGRPVEQVADPRYAQLRGAAMLARIGLGETTLEQAAALVPVAARFEPTPGSAAVHDPVYTEFTRLFRSLKPHHERLNG
jgi:xylulokinase